MSKPVLDTCHWGVEVSSSCCRCSINLDTRCLWRAQRSSLDSHNRPTQPIYSSELHLRCTVRQSHIVTPNNFCHQQQQSPQQQTETADSSRNTWFMSENCTMLTFKHRAESEPRHVVPNLNNPFFFTNLSHAGEELLWKKMICHGRSGCSRNPVGDGSLYTSRCGVWKPAEAASCFFFSLCDLVSDQTIIRNSAGTGPPPICCPVTEAFFLNSPSNPAPPPTPPPTPWACLLHSLHRLWFFAEGSDMTHQLPVYCQDDGVTWEASG